MKRRIAAIAVLLAPPVLSAGIGASDYGFLDGVKADPRTGEITLVLLVDRPLEDGLTKPKVRSKMLAYRQWVDAELIKKMPNASPDRGIRLLILYPEIKNALGRSVLEQLIGYARELRFEPIAQSLLRER